MPLFAASGFPQHMIDQLNMYLYGAFLCIAAGLFLLIVAAVVLKVRGRRASRSSFK